MNATDSNSLWKEGSLLQLRSILERITPISDEAWNDILPLFSPRQLDKQAFFLRSGTNASDIALIESGVLREFFMDAEGKEFNKAFMVPGTVTGSLYDLLSGQASIANIQALTPCKLWIASYHDFSALYDRHPCCQRLGRLIAEQLFNLKARREYHFLIKSPSERYLDLIENYPDLEQLVPQYHIASYLGITNVALSRIRKRLSTNTS